MRGVSVVAGDRFGSLTVIEHLPSHVEPSGHRRARVRTRCDCGQHHDVCVYSLQRGDAVRCKQCRYRGAQLYREGDRFDRLVIAAFTKDRRRMALCRCDCGQEIKIRPSLLSRNMTNNCGCAPRGAWSGVGDLSTTFYNKRKTAARERGLVFEVSIEFLWQLFLGQQRRCALTGLEIGFGLKTAQPSTASLDRIDSGKGYFEGNVQWVHKDVNLMKRDFSEPRFRELCVLVASHRAGWLSRGASSS